VIAIDTNLLVYALDAQAPERSAARRAIEIARSDPRGWGIALPSIAEFWRVVTHPSAKTKASTPQAAIEFLRLLTEDGAAVWALSAASWDRLLRMAVALRVRGRRIYDLHIALAALENGATEIWTHDRNFQSSPGLAVRDPL